MQSRKSSDFPDRVLLKHNPKSFGVSVDGKHLLCTRGNYQLQVTFSLGQKRHSFVQCCRKLIKGRLLQVKNQNLFNLHFYLSKVGNHFKAASVDLSSAMTRERFCLLMPYKNGLNVKIFKMHVACLSFIKFFQWHITQPVLFVYGACVNWYMLTNNSENCHQINQQSR